MKKKIIAIVDSDVDYSESFSEYISENYGEIFLVMIFKDAESYKNYFKDDYAEVLIVSNEIPDAQIIVDELKCDTLIVLLENKLTGSSKYPSIYKYQSIEAVIHEVMDIVFDSDYAVNEQIVIEDVNVIGLYSPVGRCGKTVFGLTLARLLAEKEPTLYINMEEYPIVCELLDMGEIGDLADVMYAHKQQNKDFELKLKNAIRDYHRIDYIPPLVYSSDLRNIDTNEWVDLICRIAKMGHYRNIIIDIGHVIKEPYIMLDVCNKIFMPVVNDPLSLIKVDSFENYIYQNNLTNLSEKIEKIILPDFGKYSQCQDFLDKIFWGEVGDFTRRLIENRAMN